MNKLFNDDLTFESLPEMLHSPLKKYRIYPIEHNMCDPGADVNDRVKAVKAGEAGGYVTNVTWLDKKWMRNPENLKQLGNAVAAAEKEQMQIWMYDDYYYPSGLANGYALEDHPEYITQYIDFFSKNVDAGETVTLPNDNDGYLAAGVYDFGLELIEPLKLLNNTVTVTKSGLLIAFFTNHAWEETKQTLGEAKGHLDFLNTDAVDSFISHGFQPVEDAVGIGHFTALFTDEPTLCRHSWTWKRGGFDYCCVPAPYNEKLPERYFNEWNEPFCEHLADLFVGSSERARLTRVRYYETLSRMARENYTDRIRSWCHRHGTLSSGHFLLEEGLKYHVSFYADYMRLVGGQDIPGCDLLCADASRFWLKGSGFGTACSLTAKFPSSLSRLEGHNTTMLEICPVNWPEKVTANPFKEIMGLSTYIIFSGITHYNAYGYYFIKDEAQHIRLNEYVGRLLTVLRNSSQASSVALYYPIAQTQSYFALRELHHVELPDDPIDMLPEVDELEHKFEDLNTLLLESQGDYNVIDEDHILKASAENGLTCGIVHADTIIVPYTEFMLLEVAQKLLEFAQHGVKVIFLEKTPCIELHGRNGELEKTVNEIGASFAATQEECIDLAYGQKLFEGDDILVSPYRLNGKKFWFIINKTEEDRDVKALMSGTLYDPECDEWSTPNGAFTVRAERGVLFFEV